MAEARTRLKRIQDDLLYIATLRLRVSRSKYPHDPRLQYMDTVGYLIGMISTIAEADSTVESDLYRHLRRLQSRE